MIQSYTYAFFGTGALAESVLAELCRSGYIPALVITKPDAPQGRHMMMTAPHIKTWAEMKGIEVFQPDSLKNTPSDSPLHSKKFDVFIVASYGKIIPEDILELPSSGVLNIHPSLLPQYRGPSPIESALLDGNMTMGVSVMKLDALMDHGPILAQNAFMIPLEATSGSMEVSCGQIGGKMLVETLSHYMDGTLLPKEQDHSKATTCKKITKELGLVTLTDDISDVRRKYRALTPWPGLYFFIDHKGKALRVKVNAVDMVSLKENKDLINYITSVTPEGKKQMDFDSFKRGYIDETLESAS